MKRKRHLSKAKISKFLLIVTCTILVCTLLMTSATTHLFSQNPVIKKARTMPQNHAMTIAHDFKVEWKEQVDTLITAISENIYTGRKIAFLTFDDGPSAYTADILAILNQYGVTGNFFVVGTQVDTYPEMITKIKEQGSGIFIHSTTHIYDEIYASGVAFENDLRTTKDKLNNLGIDTAYIYRFPGGSNNSYIDDALFPTFQQVLTNYGITYVDWNVDSGDANGTNPDAATILATIKQQSAGRDYLNILMHDTSSKASTREALPQIIEYLLQENYEIITMPKGIYGPEFQ